MKLLLHIIILIVTIKGTYYKKVPSTLLSEVMDILEQKSSSIDWDITDLDKNIQHSPEANLSKKLKIIAEHRTTLDLPGFKSSLPYNKLQGPPTLPALIWEMLLDKTSEKIYDKTGLP
ncbi:Hypothetical predicted protein [Pelobates cultripes]|uniref:Reverse transcriptase domain-containing protein n=1 Tax=Pelobates cultripes TaxID=61616 RepID=A0AAD1RZ11_PELCU|nr:Hypothetical predicted protein [Pelobates cultripes]